MPISGQQKSLYKFCNEYIYLNSVTQGQWYTVADLSGDLCIYFANLFRKDDDATSKQLSVRISADGDMDVLSLDFSNDTWYYMYQNVGITEKGIWATVNMVLFMYYSPLFCSSFKLEVRWDGTVGTNPQLKSSVKYSRR